MKQAVLSHFDMPSLPIAGLIIFVSCFTIYALWTFSKCNKEIYEKASRIPLEESANERRN
jgi:cbb3-type cytochrome oxidase subunit 3